MIRFTRALFAATVASVVVAPNAQAQTRPPNIVIIVADDMGYAETVQPGCVVTLPARYGG